MTIDGVTFYCDEFGWRCAIDTSFGTQDFKADPEMFEIALQPWRDHVLEGELVRREYEAAGRVSWAEYTCPDPEGDWIDMVREQGDLLRDRGREGAMVDPADETDFKDAA